ncbi:MAG: electron transport complex subunit RsxE [Treponema sp.]|nr:electron transport complex subunit RsxE [Treponema sp.]
MKRFFGIFTNGLVRENPLLILMIGLCSALAVTTKVANGIGMGLAMTFVLLMSEVVISLFKKLIPDSIRIPVFIIIIAAFTTVIDYVLKAWFPELSKAMGVFIPLIVVNCIIMGRVEGFAYKSPLGDVIFDSLGMGLGYTWVLTGISFVRELLGSGAILDYMIIPQDYQIMFFALPPGGFFVFALFISLNLFIRSKLKKPVSQTADCEGCSAHGCTVTNCGIPESLTTSASGQTSKEG